VKPKVVMSLLLLAAIAGAACSGDDSDKRGFVADQFAQVPLSALSDDGLYIEVSDVERANEVAGLDRPGKGDDEYQKWVFEIGGGSDKTFALLPSDFVLASASAMDDELGFNFGELTTSLTINRPPNTLSMLGGVDATAIDDAVGARDDGLWKIGGDERSIDDVTEVRRIGQPIRMAQRDGLTALTSEEKLAESWLDGGESLLADDGLAAVAQRLDERQVYSALVFGGTQSSTPSRNQESSLGDLETYSIVAIGLGDENDSPNGVIVYHHDDGDAAEANAELLEDGWRNAESVRTREPLSDIAKVKSVEVRGDDVVVVLELVEPPRKLLQMFSTAEPVLVAGLGD
jgi:hypothetical protein